MAVNSEIFVDKSGMIQYLNSVINTSQRFVSVSRPRRFGKTMAADMVCAYYDSEYEAETIAQKVRSNSKVETVEKAIVKTMDVVMDGRELDEKEVKAMAQYILMAVKGNG